MSTPVNCGTSFCSCIECVVPLQTMTREELDTEIVVAITVFKAAKREAHQSKLIATIDAQMQSNPELITPADESQLDRLDELLKENT